MGDDLITLTITKDEKELLIEAITSTHLPTKRSLCRILNFLKDS